MNSVNCPICFSKISADRFLNGMAYCTCGHTYSVREQDGSRDKSVAVKLVFLTLLFVGAIIHIFNWDTYSFKIVSPKLKQMVGMANTTDLNLIADICEARKKENCQIHALLKSYDLDKTQTQHLIKTGEILVSKKRFIEAVRVYGTYFKATGRDAELDARYNYAISLSETGDLQSAREQYAYLISKHHSSPKFDVARSYVDLLMKTQDLSTARQVIAEYRLSSPTASMFMDKEWRKLNAITALDTHSRLPASMNRASLNE